MKWANKLDGEFNGNPCKIRIGVSEIYSESATLKLIKMVLNINENNTVGIDNAVCIGSGYLAQMKDLASDIIDDANVC